MLPCYFFFKEHNCIILEKDYVGAKNKNKHLQVFVSHLDATPGSRLRRFLLINPLELNRCLPAPPPPPPWSTLQIQTFSWENRINMY